ncbi:MAG: thermonuclease family protein [Candidatus Nanopelagicales bacterium]|nr:thermonuclease family protein [Candidatus Nanopelagicales bacterium]
MSGVWGERVDYRPSMQIRWPRAAVALAAVALIGTVPACSSSGSEESVPSVAGEAIPDATIPDPTIPDATIPDATIATAPIGEVRDGLVVDRVVDGDTVKVTLDGEQVSVRLIGINTPETVKPGSPIECFGPESSDFAVDLLDGQSIVLEFDESQGYLDRYDRVLAYVWRVLPDGSLRLFNEEAVRGGFAYERQYTDGPYAWKDAFDDAQRDAEEAGAGLWSACES